MSETIDFEKNTKIQKYQKIRMSETTDFEKNTKIQTILENQNVRN